MRDLSVRDVGSEDGLQAVHIGPDRSRSPSVGIQMSRGKWISLQEHSVGSLRCMAIY